MWSPSPFLRTRSTASTWSPRLAQIACSFASKSTVVSDSSPPGPEHADHFTEEPQLVGERQVVDQAVGPHFVHRIVRERKAEDVVIYDDEVIRRGLVRIPRTNELERVRVNIHVLWKRTAAAADIDPERPAFHELPLPLDVCGERPVVPDVVGLRKRPVAEDEQHRIPGAIRLPGPDARGYEQSARRILQGMCFASCRVVHDHIHPPCQADQELSQHPVGVVSTDRVRLRCLDEKAPIDLERQVFACLDHRQHAFARRVLAERHAYDVRDGRQWCPAHAASPPYGSCDGASSRRRGYAASRGASSGVPTGHLMPISGSFQISPPSSEGSYGWSTL